MSLNLNQNWTTDNNGFPLENSEVRRYTAVVPTENQLRLQSNPFYAFIHFGMNTATNREWGTGKEQLKDFTIAQIHPRQWVKTIKSAGMSGIILTCKHHDGFCLWNTKTTDFNVMNTTLGLDVVKKLSVECQKQKLQFGIYLSPWDMHADCYGKQTYNDYFVKQLTELCTHYGPLFEVWFDGARGKNAQDFQYDWQRYYQVIHTLQPCANIAICGPDIRWVGNEAGKTRKSEYSVVPSLLRKSELVQAKSQHSEKDADRFMNLKSQDEDLGSRKVLRRYKDLAWYPAEVDVSIRKGWFFHEEENKTVKTSTQLFNIYLNSVGNNCILLLNVPANQKGLIDAIDCKQLQDLGNKIKGVTEHPVSCSEDRNKGYTKIIFKHVQQVRYCVFEEDITYSQRVEKFDLYFLNQAGHYQKVYTGTIIGAKKIIALDNIQAKGALLIIRQSRGIPHLKTIAFYA